MSQIDDLLTAILTREGWPTVTNRAADRGGLTKGGVTFDSYTRWQQQRGQTPILPTEFPNLSEADARAFMLAEIAGPLMSLRDVAGEALFGLLVDWAETSGPDDPIRALQSALLAADVYAGAIDGEAGPLTYRALSAVTLDLDALMRSVGKARVEFYLALALKDPAVVAFRKQSPSTQLENVHGLIARALEFL